MPSRRTSSLSGAQALAFALALGAAGYTPLRAEGPSRPVILPPGPAGSWSPSPEPPPPRPDRNQDLRERLQGVLNAFHRGGTFPGVSAAVSLPDGSVLAVTAGESDTVRHVPIDQEAFAYYGEDLLPNFDAVPTWKYATPHNIQLNTPQTETCDACHGNAELFLSADDVLPEELEANKDVIVEEIPPAIGGGR